MQIQSNSFNQRCLVAHALCWRKVARQDKPFAAADAQAPFHDFCSAHRCLLLHQAPALLCLQLVLQLCYAKLGIL